MNGRFLAAVPVAQINRLRDKEDNDHPRDNYVGYRVNFDPNELESTNYRMLQPSVGLQSSSFVLPQEQPIQLLFLRTVFTRLREESTGHAEKLQGSDLLPFEAFQRAFERLFFLLRDPVPFNAYKDYDENGDGYVAWEEFYHVYRRRNITVTLSPCERIFLTFDAPDLAETSYLSHIVSIVILLTILLSSCCFILSTHPKFQVHIGVPPYQDAPSAAPVLETIDLACLVLFVVEYVVRLATCWGVRLELFDKTKLIELVTGYDPIQLPSPWRRLIKFVIAPTNLVDLAAILPAVLSLMMAGDGGGFVVLRLIRLTRIFRVFRTPALTEPVVVITRTIQRSTKALYVLAFNLLLGIVIFGSLMFLAEGQGIWDPLTRTYLRIVGKSWNNSTGAMEDVLETTPFQSIPHTFWWAMVTATTVGYGDHYPTTSTGYLVAVLTMVFSLVILALPVGVIGGTFSQVWDDFAVEKRAEAESTRDHGRAITSAMSRLDPSKMSNLMLIEVWNEQDGPTDGTSRAPALFMGEAKVELELTADTPVVKIIVVPLQENRDIVNRSVTGRVTIRYEWTPTVCTDSQADVVTGWGPEADISPNSRHSSSSSAEINRANTVSVKFDLRGVLKVSVVSGDHLLNLGSTRRNGASSPYCSVLVYPTSPEDGCKISPCLWRTPALSNTCTPRWDASHCFEFNWNTFRAKVETWDQLSTPDASPSSVKGWASRPRPSSDPQEKKKGATLDDAMNAILGLGVQLKQIREEVHALSERVDDLTADGTGAASSLEAKTASGTAGGAVGSGDASLPSCVDFDPCD